MRPPADVPEASLSQSSSRTYFVAATLKDQLAITTQLGRIYVKLQAHICPSQIENTSDDEDFLQTEYGRSSVVHQLDLLLTHEELGLEPRRRRLDLNLKPVCFLRKLSLFEVAKISQDLVQIEVGIIENDVRRLNEVWPISKIVIVLVSADTPSDFALPVI